MKARNGQVALYLVLVIVALAVLMMMNVSTFLAVRSKNRMMNAVDAAAIAVANWQGDRLNRLGEMNVRHLRHLINPLRADWSEEDVLLMREMAAFDPLEGIAIGNRTAAAWGFEEPMDDEIAACFRQHLNEIADEYCNNPDLFPEYRERQWADYAAKLSSYINGGLIVAPGFMETANGWSQEPLLSGAFYDAIAARAWCWFGIGGRSRYFDLDSKTMPRPEFAEPRVQENSEIYSLHVTFKTWMDSAWADEYVPNEGFSRRWTNFVCQVTGCTEAELAAAGSRVTDPREVFAFYDSRWHSWSQPQRYFAGFNPENYPIAGSVKSEYDVAGCVASCLMLGSVTRLVGDTASERSMIVTAEAKPLGTVTFEGEMRPVTAFHSFIAPSHPNERIFTEAQLVLMHSVPRDPGVSLSPQWYLHVKEHLPRYFANGPTGEVGCYYCRQLQQWEDPNFRAQAREWLTRHGETCRTGGGPGDEKGGYDWAH